MGAPLENASEIVRRMRKTSEALEGRRIPPAAREVVDDFVTLDRLLSNGRSLPMQWRSRRAGREPLTKDGPIVEGVRHGTRYGYNQKCKCGPCRAANRGESKEIINQMLAERGWPLLHERNSHG